MGARSPLLQARFRMSGIIVASILLGGGTPTGGVPLPRVIADARLAVLGSRDGRVAEAGAASQRIEFLEDETARRWRENSAGPRAHLAALALAHAVAGEAQLASDFAPEVLDELQRAWFECHRTVPGEGGLFAASAFMADLREHRSAIDEALNKVPETRAVMVAALSQSRVGVRFDPTEPTTAPGQCLPGAGVSYIRLSSRLRPGPGADRFLVVPIFEAFNVRSLPQHDTLRSRAASGRTSRDSFVRATAALEQLAHAQLLWVLRQQFRELEEAGLAATPEAWSIRSFGLFTPPPPSRHVPTRGYPHRVYGTAYDRLRLAEEARPGGDLWEAAVLLDRIWFHNQILEGDREFLLEQGRRLNRLEYTNPWAVLHRHLPRPVRVWLSTVRGGERVAAVCRAGRAAAGAVPAVGPFGGL